MEMSVLPCAAHLSKIRLGVVWDLEWEAQALLKRSLKLQPWCDFCLILILRLNMELK